MARIEDKDSTNQGVAVGPRSARGGAASPTTDYRNRVSESGAAVGPTSARGQMGAAATRVAAQLQPVLQRQNDINNALTYFNTAFDDNGQYVGGNTDWETSNKWREQAAQWLDEAKTERDKKYYGELYGAFEQLMFADNNYRKDQADERLRYLNDQIDRDKKNLDWFTPDLDQYYTVKSQIEDRYKASVAERDALEAERKTWGDNQTQEMKDWIARMQETGADQRMEEELRNADLKRIEELSEELDKAGYFEYDYEGDDPELDAKQKEMETLMGRLGTNYYAKTVLEDRESTQAALDYYNTMFGNNPQYYTGRDKAHATIKSVDERGKASLYGGLSAAASVASGAIESVQKEHDPYWRSSYNDALMQGYSTEDAIVYADTALKKKQNEERATYLGNESESPRQLYERKLAETGDPEKADKALRERRSAEKEYEAKKKAAQERIANGYDDVYKKALEETGDEIQAKLAVQQAMKEDKQYSDEPGFWDKVDAKLNEKADEYFDKYLSYSAMSAEETAKIKEGLGPVGRFAVDATQTALEMAYDIALSYVLAGAGGALAGGAVAADSLIPMFARVFGSGYGEGLASGATKEQAVDYGLAQAGIEVLTEKIFGLPNVGRGGGTELTREMSEEIVKRLATSDAGRSMLRVIVMGVEEGSEELLGSILEPIAQSIIKADPDGINWKDGLYEALIGFALGAFGGTRFTLQSKAETALDIRENGAKAELHGTEAMNHELRIGDMADYMKYEKAPSGDMTKQMEEGKRYLEEEATPEELELAAKNSGLLAGAVDVDANGRVVEAQQGREQAIQNAQESNAAVPNPERQATANQIIDRLNKLRQIPADQKISPDMKLSREEYVFAVTNGLIQEGEAGRFVLSTTEEAKLKQKEDVTTPANAPEGEGADGQTPSDEQPQRRTRRDERMDAAKLGYAARNAESTGEAFIQSQNEKAEAQHELNEKMKPGQKVEPEAPQAKEEAPAPTQTQEEAKEAPEEKKAPEKKEAPRKKERPKNQLVLEEPEPITDAEKTEYKAKVRDGLKHTKSEDQFAALTKSEFSRKTVAKLLGLNEDATIDEIHQAWVDFRGGKKTKAPAPKPKEKAPEAPKPKPTEKPKPESKRITKKQVDDAINKAESIKDLDPLLSTEAGRKAVIKYLNQFTKSEERRLPEDATEKEIRAKILEDYNFGEEYVDSDAEEEYSEKEEDVEESTEEGEEEQPVEGEQPADEAEPIKEAEPVGEAEVAEEEAPEPTEEKLAEEEPESPAEEPAPETPVESAPEEATPEGESVPPESETPTEEVKPASEETQEKPKWDGSLETDKKGHLIGELSSEEQAKRERGEYQKRKEEVQAKIKAREYTLEECAEIWVNEPDMRGQMNLAVGIGNRKKWSGFRAAYEAPPIAATSEQKTYTIAEPTNNYEAEVYAFLMKGDAEKLLKQMTQLGAAYKNAFRALTGVKLSGTEAKMRLAIEDVVNNIERGETTNGEAESAAGSAAKETASVVRNDETQNDGSPTDDGGRNRRVVRKDSEKTAEYFGTTEERAAELRAAWDEHVKAQEEEGAEVVGLEDCREEDRVFFEAMLDADPNLKITLFNAAKMEYTDRLGFSDAKNPELGFFAFVNAVDADAGTGTVGLHEYGHHAGDNYARQHDGKRPDYKKLYQGIFQDVSIDDDPIMQTVIDQYGGDLAYLAVKGKPNASKWLKDYNGADYYGKWVILGSIKGAQPLLYEELYEEAMMSVAAGWDVLAEAKGGRFRSYQLKAQASLEAIGGVPAGFYKATEKAAKNADAASKADIDTSVRSFKNTPKQYIGNKHSPNVALGPDGYYHAVTHKGTPNIKEVTKRLTHGERAGLFAKEGEHTSLEARTEAAELNIRSHRYDQMYQRLTSIPPIEMNPVEQRELQLMIGIINDELKTRATTVGHKPVNKWLPANSDTLEGNLAVLVEAEEEFSRAMGTGLSNRSRLSDGEVVRNRASKNMMGDVRRQDIDPMSVNAQVYHVIDTQTRYTDEIKRRTERPNNPGEAYTVDEAVKLLAEQVKEINRIRGIENLYRASRKAESASNKLVDLIVKADPNAYNTLMTMAYASASRICDDFSSVSFAETMTQIRYLNMLSNLATVVSNIGNNQISVRQEQANQNIGRLLSGWAFKNIVNQDALAKDKTKGLLFGLTDPAHRQAMGVAAAKSILSLYYGLDIEFDSEVANPDYNGGSRFTHNGNGFERFVRRWSILSGIGMQTTDAIQKAETLQGLKEGVDELNISDEEKAARMPELVQESNRRLFHDENAATRIMEGARAGLDHVRIGTRSTGTIGLGTLMLPFVKVPTNVVMRAVRSTPIGTIYGLTQFAKGIADAQWRHARIVDAKARNETAKYSDGTEIKDVTIQDIAKMQRALGLAVTNTMLTLLGAWARAAGFLRDFDDEDDEDIQKIRMAKNLKGLQLDLSAILRPGTELKADDVYIGGDWLQVLALPLSIGAMAWDAAEGTDDPASNALKSLLMSPYTALDDIFNACKNLPGMTQMSELWSAYENAQYYDTDEEKVSAFGQAMTQVTASNMASFVLPNIYTQLGAGLDNTVRNAYSQTNPVGTFADIVKSKTVFLRRMLPERKDSFGNTRRYGDNTGLALLNRMLLPGDVTIDRQNDAEKEVLRLTKEGGGNIAPTRSAPKTVKDNTGTVHTLSADDKDKFSKVYTDAYNFYVSTAASSKLYQRLSVEDQCSLIRELRAEAWREAEASFLQQPKAKDGTITFENWEAQLKGGQEQVDYLAAKYLAGDVYDKKANKVSDYEAMDKYITNVYMGLNDAQRDMLNNSYAHLDDLYDARNHGISSELWQQAQDIYNRYNQEGVKHNLVTQAEMWEKMSDLPGAGDRQQDWFEEHYKLYNHNPVKADKYFALTDGAGLDEKAASRTIEEVSKLPILPGRKGVSNNQIYWTIANANWMSDEQKWAVFQTYATEKAWEKVNKNRRTYPLLSTCLSLTKDYSSYDK